jgi:hypothetical protein
MAADPDIIGKTLTLDGIAHIVVGVAPEHYSGHLGYQERRLFLPLGRYAPLRADDKVRTDRANEWLNIHGRLSPGVSMAQANAAVAGVTAGLATQYPPTNEFKAAIVVPYDPLGLANSGRQTSSHPDRRVLCGVSSLRRCWFAARCVSGTFDTPAIGASRDGWRNIC